MRHEPADIGVWPHARAALVALHVVVLTVMALPSPDGGLDRTAWRDPTVQDELRNWTATLNGWGSTITQPELEDRLWRAAVSYSEARGAVLGPVRPYAEWCGTEQSWRMFVAPHRHPTALHIDVRENREWRPVYAERDPRHRWLARELDSYRFRSTIFRFGWPAYEGEFGGFAGWVANRAGRDFPAADRVRVRLFKTRTRSPEEVRAGAAIEGEFVLSVELPTGGRP